MRRIAQRISPASLGDIFQYDPQSGALYWRERELKWFQSERTWKIWNSKYPNTVAGQSDASGYVLVTILGRRYKAHRVIIAMITGDWPVDEVDHIDHDRKNNKIENLRCVSHRENTKNRGISTANKSGTLGIFWEERRRKWKAEIKANGKKLNLGRFHTIEGAKAARRNALAELGFHENHGM